MAAIDVSLLTDAAKLICGSNPSQPFMELLAEQVAVLPELFVGTQARPTRRDMLDRLAAAKESAELLSKELADLDFATTATLGTTDFNYLAFGRDLDTLGNLISEAQVLLPGRGSDRSPSLVDGISLQPRSPELVCAVITSAAWQAARGSNIPHTNSNARDAASLIWAAACLPVTTDNWLDWLKRAKLVTADDTAGGSLAPWFIQRWAAFAST